MSQRIEITAGDDVVGSTIQDIFKALSSPGILEGFNLTVALNGKQVRVSPGVGLLDSGAFIWEDQPIETSELPIGGGPKDFTVLYRYTPTNTLGGSPAVLAVEEGLYNPDTFTGGLILGWIRHSGASTLDQKDFIPGRRVKLSIAKEKKKNEFQTSFAPLSTKWALVTGSQPTVAEGWNPTYSAIVTTLSNTTSSVLNATYNFPLLIPSTGLGQILVECEVPNTANLVVSIIDTSGNEYTGGATWTFIASSMSRKILAIPQSLTLANGQMAFIKLAMTLQPGSYMRFKTLGFSSYTEPF